VDRRLRADEKRIRAQSAILDKSNPKPWFSIHNRVFGTDALFIRTKNRVGARERAMALGRRRNLRLGK